MLFIVGRARHLLLRSWRAFGTALVGPKALESGANRNLVGVDRPDDEVRGRFRRCLPCVGALQSGRVGWPLLTWCLTHRGNVALPQRTCICLRRQDDGLRVPVLAGSYGGCPRSPISVGDRGEPFYAPPLAAAANGANAANAAMNTRRSALRTVCLLVMRPYEHSRLLSLGATLFDLAQCRETGRPFAENPFQNRGNRPVFDVSSIPLAGNQAIFLR